MRLGTVEKSAVGDKSDYEKIKLYTRKEFDENELYIFTLVLCDNDIDRDFERFSLKSLNELAELFKGKTGIFDHSMRSNDQTARIFDTWCEKQDKATSYGEPLVCLKAKAYMVKTEDNESLIKEIDAGIKKEVSVSCAVKSAICSICGGNKKSGECNHIAGKEYDGITAFSTLEGVEDAYEWSFVAVPAQRGAGVTKSFSTKKDDEKMRDIIKNLDESKNSVITENDIKVIKSYIKSLEQEAILGREYKESLKSEVISLCLSEFPQLDSKTFEGIAQVMTAKELISFKKAFEKRKESENAVFQLAKKDDNDKTNNNEYLI